MKVPLDDIVLVWVEVREVTREENASSLRCSFWLRDERLAIQPFLLVLGLVGELFLEFTELCWQKPSLGEELVILGMVLEHSLQISC